MVHNLHNKRSYPKHHFWVSTPNKLNLFANLEVKRADIILFNEKKYKVEKLKQEPSKDFDFATPGTTIAYELIISPLN